jgi:hypothetical protein
MSYTINKYNGSILTSIPDGAADTSATNLTLPGPNYVGYGQNLNENLVYLLENFASNSAPIGTNLQGQLWFDTYHQNLNVFTSQGYVPVSGVVLGSSQPVAPKDGEFWLNSSTNQLYISRSGVYKLIGPNYTSAMGVSGAIPVTMNDLNVPGVTHNVVQLQFGNIVLATLSSDTAFVPSPVPLGFPQIYPGLTINNSLISGSAQLYTNANTAAYLASGTDATINRINSNLTSISSNLNLVLTSANALITSSNIALTSFIDGRVSTINTILNDSVQTLNNTANAIVANTNAIAANLTANINQVYSDFVTNIATINSDLSGVTTAWTANAAIQQAQINNLSASAYTNANVATYLTSNNNISAGTITATTPAYNDNSTQVATTAYVNSVVPRGVIWMWNSSAATIPTGWQLCNGSNGTPDLRGQFIVASTGDTGAYITGNTGGTSSFTVGVNNLPSHTHAISIGATTGAGGGHSHTASSSSTSVVNDPGHTHLFPGDDQLVNSGVVTSAGAFNYDAVSTLSGGGQIYHTSSATTGITTTTSTSTSLSAVGDHTHSLSITGNTGSTGAGTAIDNRPPYYALCYIQKMY